MDSLEANNKMTDSSACAVSVEFPAPLFMPVDCAEHVFAQTSQPQPRAALDSKATGESNYTRRHKYEKNSPPWVRGSAGAGRRGVVGIRTGRTTPAMAFGHSFPSSTDEGSILLLVNVVSLCRHV